MTRPGDLAPVHLDVGGKHYTTSLATLQAVPGSRIYKTFSGRLATILDKKTNCYFLDRDGELFSYVLQYLRTGSLLLPADFNAWEELEIEANYWDLKDLERLTKQEHLKRSDRLSMVVMKQIESDKIKITGSLHAVNLIVSNQPHVDWVVGSESDRRDKIVIGS